jgi:hypothetical protein
LKRTTSILLAAARFVLSMNWKHHIKIPDLAHQLICTACPPKRRGEPRANNSDPPAKSRLSAFSIPKLFTTNRRKKTGGEQVAAGIFGNFWTAIHPR